MRPPDSRPDSLLRRGGMGAVLAAIAFVVVASLVTAAIVFGTSDDGEDPEANARTGEGAAGSERPPADAGAGTPKRPAVAPVSLDEIKWTTDAPATLTELGRAWSIPRDRLTELNPDLPEREEIAAGTEVIVHSHALGESVSVGSPNDGRLIGGVPLPEGDGWALPEDRTRAFATAETIASLTAALRAYGRQFPDADPIQVGDLSARRGGAIFGHQSHQTGRDVDIRLIADATGDGFDARRNWFLVRTLIDAGDITAIFLNTSEQTWLRAAAEADVGADSAATYFALIDHEPGHTIHMHVRFACPEGQSRCVAYAQPDAGEQDPRVGKLPPGLGGKPTPKLPRVRPKTTRKTPATKTLKPTKKPR